MILVLSRQNGPLLVINIISGVTSITPKNSLINE